MVSPVDSSRNLGDSQNLYGYSELSEICESHIVRLFDVSPPPTSTLHAGLLTPPPSPPHKSTAPPPLVEFIAYALYRTRLPVSIVYQALILLERLKHKYPSARGTSSSPHRLFLAALMLASKMAMDDTYSNKSWAIVGGGCFALREVNQMERELFAFLGCNVHVACEEVDAFTARLEANKRAGLPPTPPLTPIEARQPAIQQRTTQKRRRTPSTDVEPDRASRAADAALALLRPLGRSDAYAASRHVPPIQTHSPWSSVGSSSTASPNPITPEQLSHGQWPSYVYGATKVAPPPSWPLQQQYAGWQ